jgi:hypothetical protein
LFEQQVFETTDKALRNKGSKQQMQLQQNNMTINSANPLIIADHELHCHANTQNTAIHKKNRFTLHFVHRQKQHIKIHSSKSLFVLILISEFAIQLTRNSMQFAQKSSAKPKQNQTKTKQPKKIQLLSKNSTFDSKN